MGVVPASVAVGGKRGVLAELAGWESPSEGEVLKNGAVATVPALPTMFGRAGSLSCMSLSESPRLVTLVGGRAVTVVPASLPPAERFV